MNRLLADTDLVLAFASRDFSTRYRTSLLGWVWGLIQPLVQLALWAFVFGVIFRVQPPPLGSDPSKGNFAAFLFTGMVTWNLFSQILTYSMLQLSGSADLLKKAYFPAWAPILGGSLVQLVQTTLEIFVLMSFLLMLGNNGLVWLAAVPVLLSLALFSQGVGLLLALLNVRYGDVLNIVGLTISVFYFLTPILYPLELVQAASPVAARLIQSHPMTWFVEVMQSIMYSLEFPDPFNYSAVLIFGPVTFAVCYLVFNRFSPRVRMWS